MMLFFALICLRNYRYIQKSIIPNRITPLPPLIELEDGPKYEVVVILNSKIVRNKLYYLVDWLGYSPSECTWASMRNLAYARALPEKTSIVNIRINQVLNQR